MWCAVSLCPPADLCASLFLILPLPPGCCRRQHLWQTSTTVFCSPSPKVNAPRTLMCRPRTRNQLNETYTRHVMATSSTQWTCVKMGIGSVARQLCCEFDSQQQLTPPINQSRCHNVKIDSTFQKRRTQYLNKASARPWPTDQPTSSRSRKLV